MPFLIYNNEKLEYTNELDLVKNMNILLCQSELITWLIEVNSNLELIKPDNTVKINIDLSSFDYKQYVEYFIFPLNSNKFKKLNICNPSDIYYIFINKDILLMDPYILLTKYFGLSNIDIYQAFIYHLNKSIKVSNTIVKTNLMQIICDFININNYGNIELKKSFQTLLLYYINSISASPFNIIYNFLPYKE